MQHYPAIAVEVEDAYRRERTAAHFRAAGSRSLRSDRDTSSRLRLRRRRDRAAR